MRRIGSMLWMGLVALAACGGPSGPIEIRVTGRNFTWEVQYPGPDRQLDTKDDWFGRRHVHIPVDTDVTLHLRSEDYVYTFFLPELEHNQIAVPDMHFSISLRVPRTGPYRLLGSQMCGYDHPNLLGNLLVEPVHAFDVGPTDREDKGGI